MTAEEYIGDLKSRIKVEPSEKENFFRLKYGDNYKQLIISNRDYMNQFLLNPLLQVLDKKEKEKLSTTIVNAVPLDKIRAYGIKVNTEEYAVVFNERLLGLISAYNEIRLIEEVEELAKRGIHKDYNGLIVDINGNIYTVCFFNPYNRGESVYAMVNQKFLKFSSRVDEKNYPRNGRVFPKRKNGFQ